MITPPKHNFRPFQGDASVCVLCGKTEENHNLETICDVCEKKSPILKYTPENASGPLNYCPDCLAEEHKAEDSRRYERMTPDQRVETMHENWKTRVMKEIKTKLDEEITIRTDVFNAEIPSLISLKAKVDSDETIPADKKDEAFALLVSAQLTHLSDVAFPELKSAEGVMISRMKSLQQFLNDFVGKLSAEAREKIKIKDISYQPKTTTPKAPKVSAPKTVKFDRSDIERVIKEFPYLDMASIRSLCVSFNQTPDELAAGIRSGKMGKKVN